MPTTVEDMAKAGYTTARGIRFWEEQGLLGTVERTSGKQRRYTDEQLDRARIIAAAKFAGWELDDVRKMLDCYNTDAFEAIRLRLAQQAMVATQLGEQLPTPKMIEWDL